VKVFGKEHKHGAEGKQQFADAANHILTLWFFSRWCEHYVITYPSQIKTFPGHCCNKASQKWWRHSHKSRQGTTLCSVPMGYHNQPSKQM